MRKRLLALLFCSLAACTLGASELFADDNALADAEKLVKKHIEKVLKEAPKFIDSYGKSVGERMLQDSKGGTIAGVESPRHHPWNNNGNPTSPLVYRLDSYFNLSAEMPNIFNWSQAWSCFEPKLLAKARNGREMVFVAGPGNEDLIAECRSKCVNQMQHIPHPRGSIIGAIMYIAYGGLRDPDRWGYTENGYEVVEFWFPEYQVEINNYGINRIQPQLLSPTGNQFTRKSLLQQKESVEQQMLQELSSQKSYPLKTSGLKKPDRPDPMKGQGRGSTQDHEDKAYGHVVRTYLSTSEEEKKNPTRDGWQVDPEKAVFGVLPKKMAEHDPVNIWTEHGLFDVITSIPHMSSKIRPKIMKALFGKEKPYSEKAREKKGFYQSKGATAYRMAKWPQIYKPLERVGIKAKKDSSLKEVVYKGGYDLFPLVTNQSGFGSPHISTGAVFARRVLYLAGARSPVERGGDASGTVENAFPQGGEMGRIMTYTISSKDKSREIDKMQLISPKRPKDGQAYGGYPPMVSECFRSQNIPNFTNKDKKLQKWADRHLPRKLVGYWSDIDFVGQQGGSITFTYWNRRIGCNCDRLGIPTGSSLIADGGDGDKLYDKPRKEYCRYPLLPRMTPWSAWHKKDTFKECQANGKNESFYEGTGLKDKV